MKIGIIGGSGLYRLSEDAEVELVEVQTPFGKPSAPFCRETVGPNTAYFLTRHGEGHRISPSEINYRANIFALKKLGVSAVISISAVGSMKEEIHPGDFVLPAQYIDMTKRRVSTFFEGGVVGHAHFADPTCRCLREHIVKNAQELEIRVHEGGTYVCIEGPQFSTRSESNLYRSWNLPGGGVNVIGMTAVPEAKLAREAGLCYQTVAMATDYDCWNESHEDVSVEKILKVLQDNVSTSRRLAKHLLSSPFPACQSGCREAIKNAVMTSKDHWPEGKREIVDVLLS